MVADQQTEIPTEYAVSLRGVGKLYSRRDDRADTIKETMLTSLSRRARSDLITALDGIDLEITRGEAIGLIGPNGSGKSTLLKIIAGITTPTAGTVRASGRVTGMIELGAGFHPDLSGEENIRLQGSIFGLSAAQIEERIEPILDFAELAEFREMPVKHYSSGMFVRLGFAIAMHTQPEVLLVDEVLAVGDLAFQERCLCCIRRMIEGGMTLVLVTHYPEQAERVCGRVVWLEGGRVHRIGPAAAVLADYHSDLIARQYAAPAGQFNERAVAAGVSGRFGGGEAHITEVRLLDESGRRCSHFRRGQAMAIEVAYTAAPGIESVDCVVALEDTASGTLLSLWRAFRDAQPSRPWDGKGAFRLDIEQLPLLCGRYGLTIALHPAGDITVEYDVLYKLIHFTIEMEPGWDTVAPVEIRPRLVS
ncbi:ABC transporter ATP-binding protein [bacterium]|nr:ABC transporter ATP-binding protein [bacterium]